MKRFIPAIVLMALVWAGCGGKSTTTTTTVAVTISPTTASVAGGGTQQFTATVTGSTNTAVTWQVNAVTGGTALTGTISTTGLYTAPTVIPVGTTAVNIGAIAQADTTAVANVTVTLTVPTVTIAIAPLSATVAAGGTVQFTSTVTSTDNNTAVTWSVNGCPVAANCGTVSSTGLYTAPLSPPQEAITVTATSVSNGTFTASAPVSVQFGKASVSGTYVFLATQADNGSGSGFALRAGRFVADGAGNITSGIEDSNSSAGAVAATSLTGTYTVGADGRGTMTITDTASHTFSFALTSNTRGQMIGFDSGAATGLIRQQNQTAIAGVSGAFVFGLSGDNGGPAAAVGQLNVSGALVTGSEDFSINGAVTQGAGIAGAFTAPAGGRGTAANFVYYIIDASTLVLIGTDNFGSRLAGTAIAQSTSPFTTASLGSSSYFVAGNAVPGSKPYAQAGRFDTDGVSKLTGGVFDTNNAGNVMQNASFSNTTSYKLSASAPTNGRGTITGSSNFIFWLASPTQGFVLENDSGIVAEGTLFQQQVGIGAISGGYEFAVGGTTADGTTPQAIGGVLTIGGFGVLSGTEDLNLGNGNFQSGASISGNPSLVITLATGRATATVNGTVNTNGVSSVVSSVPYSFYLINSNRFIMFSTSPSAVLSGVGERQCSDCQF